MLSLWRSKFFLKIRALLSKLLILAVRVAETDPMNLNVRASIKLVIGFARFLARARLLAFSLLVRKEPFGFFSQKGTPANIY